MSEAQLGRRIPWNEFIKNYRENKIKKNVTADEVMDYDRPDPLVSYTRIYDDIKDPMVQVAPHQYVCREYSSRAIAALPATPALPAPPEGKNDDL